MPKKIDRFSCSPSPQVEDGADNNTGIDLSNNALAPPDNINREEQSAVDNNAIIVGSADDPPLSQDIPATQKSLVECSAPQCKLHLHCVPQDTGRLLHQFPEFVGLSCFNIAHSKHCEGLFGFDSRQQYPIRLSHPIWKKLRHAYGLTINVKRPLKKRANSARLEYSDDGGDDFNDDDGNVEDGNDDDGNDDDGNEEEKEESDNEDAQKVGKSHDGKIFNAMSDERVTRSRNLANVDEVEVDSSPQRKSQRLLKKYEV